MDVKVRELEDHVVQRLDQVAKGKGMSREKFLKEQLEKLAAEGEISQHEKGYKDMLYKVLYVIQENTTLLRLLREEMLLFEKEQEEEMYEETGHSNKL